MRVNSSTPSQPQRYLRVGQKLLALKNKAMVWTRKALEDAAGVIPLPLRKLHSDNGSEFINAHVHKFCEQRGIDFTRSRPYRKNDSPYVKEQELVYG